MTLPDAPSELMILHVRQLESVLREAALCDSNTGKVFFGLLYEYRVFGELSCRTYKEFTTCLSDAIAHVDEFSNTPSSLQTLASDEVLFLHESIGIIHYRQGEYKSSIESFIKILWMLPKRGGKDPFHIALTQHRLSMVYRKMGCDDEASKLLKKAGKGYKKSGHKKPKHNYLAKAVDCEHQETSSKFSSKILTMIGF